MDDELNEEARRPFLTPKATGKAYDFRTSRNTRLTPAHAILAASLVISLLCNVFTIFVILSHSPSRTPTNTDSDSPITDNIKLEYSNHHFDAKHSIDTIYRHLGSVEVDQAWEALGSDYRPFLVTESEAERYGLDPRMVKVDPENGGGFPVVSWAMFNMHCLNLVRRTSFWEYEYYKQLPFDPFQHTEDYPHNSTAFCVDILRQQIMCSADTAIMGLWWSSERGMAPDVQSRHQCRNFDDIRQYAESHQISLNPRLFKFREGDIRLEHI